MRRRFNKLTYFKNVEKLDAFPKIHEGYTIATTSGGTISILSFIIIIILVYSEVHYYSSSQLKFEYSVDQDIDSKLKINLDITVAMPCAMIGADILDVTNQNTKTFGKLEEEPAYFELSPRQKSHWDTMQKINSYIREEYHAIQELMWKEGYTNMLSGLPSSDSIPVGEPDACRLRGSLVVNKVSGNFHIIAGKHIPHPAGHAHLSAFLADSESKVCEEPTQHECKLNFNFSHRIEKFSFGDPIAGVFGPLEGDEKIATTNYHLYQYYIKVVPTEINSPPALQTAFQYSVTEQERPINHQTGSHGVPGIYFKYDMSFVKVKISLEKHSLWRFLVRLCGIIGGVFATSGILNGLVKFIVELVTCRFVPSAVRRSGKGHDLTSSLEPSEVPEAPKIASLCVVPEDQLAKDVNSFRL